MNLSQDQAQKLVDVYAKNVQKVVEEPFTAYETMREGWRNDVKKDAELWSGEALRPEVNATIGRALDQLDVGRKEGAPSLAESFKQAMNITGAGDHPAFVKAFYRMAKSFTEGRPVTQIKPSTAPQPGQKAAGPGPSALFPNLPNQSQTG